MAGRRENVEFIVDRLIADMRSDRVEFDAVLVQEAAGRILGEAIERKLGKRTIVVETDERSRPTKKLINETTLYRGDRVLIVTEIATTGTGMRTMTRLVGDRKGAPVAVAAFATRNRDEVSSFEREEQIKVYALAALAFEGKTYGKAGREAKKTECEECRKGKPPISSWEI